jgi:arsenate reductase (thioredoxin)
MPDVLFLCTGNSCRSQMAEGWLRHLVGEHYQALSAGLKPGIVHPLAIEVMREAGVDISGQRSKDVATFLGRRFAYIITVCDRARDACPIFPGPSIREHWPIEDPGTAQGSHEERLRVFRKVRDNIAAQLLQFLASQTVIPSPDRRGHDLTNS